MSDAAPNPLAGLVIKHGVYLLPFDARHFGCWEDARAPHALRPHTAEETLAANPDAVAVLNGPMFEVTDPVHTDYQRYLTGKLDYHLYDSRGVSDDGGTATDARGVTLSVTPSGVIAQSGDAVTPDATAAVQLYPPLVRGGVAVASAQKNTDVTWRAALALLADGRLAFAVGHMPMAQFAAALVALGAAEAGYTDGGGSARLAVRGKFYGSSENRRVVSWLLVRAQLPVNNEVAS